jgi:hypothetical protein
MVLLTGLRVSAFKSMSNGTPVAHLVEGAQGSVLQLSMRRVHDLVAFATPYEFEDVVAEVTGADRVEPDDFEAVEFARRLYKLGRLATRSRRLAKAIVPDLSTVRLTRDYDLFFPVFNHPFELYALAAVPDWRARCRHAACFISEIWAHDVPEYLVELLSEFDHVFIGTSNSIDRIGRLVGKPCTNLPLAVDVLRFSPYPNLPPRAIDVCNIGRRSPVTHAALLELARERRIFYYYDTVRATGPRGKQMTFSVGNAAEHRLLLANLLQRTRYYVAYRARVNEPETTKGTEEISARFYEGVAAGAVLLGAPPRSETFRRLFDWQDVVVPLPFDSPDVGEFLARLDADRERVARIRRDNVYHAARRHDWVYRLRAVFEALGLAPTEGILAREARLAAIAEMTLQRPQHVPGDGLADRE